MCRLVWRGLIIEKFAAHGLYREKSYLSMLLRWAFGPRKPMKNWDHGTTGGEGCRDSG
jgi:hypothetical protein